MPLVPLPDQGRRYDDRRRVLLSDTTPDGRLRLDAIARFLHDIATLDNTDAPLADKGLWVIRSIDIEVFAWPRYLDAVALTTAVSGTGRAWAERRTDLSVRGDLLVGAAAVWVNTRPDTGTPASLPEGFDEVYGEAAGGRRVRPSLVIDPPTGEPGAIWRIDLRRSDLDIVDHVNNAIHLALVEEALWRADLAAILDAPAHVRIEFPRSLPGGSTATVSLWRTDPLIVVVGDDEGPSSITAIEPLEVPSA